MLIYKDCIDESEGLQYTCDPCNETEGGGIRSLCLLKKGAVIPNPYVKADIEALVLANQLWVMAETRGTFDGGVPKMVTGYGDKKERQIGADYTLQVKDPIYADNYEFWQGVENVEDWNVAFRTETQLAVIYSDCTITTKAPAEEGLDSEVVWNIEVKWSAKIKPELIPFVIGSFENLAIGTITGLSITVGDSISVTVDADKSCSVTFSDNSVVNSVGGTFEVVQAPVSGAITINFDKATTALNVVGYLSGDLVTNAVNNFECVYNPLIESITANDLEGSLFASSMAALTSAVVPKATSVEVFNSPLLTLLSCPKSTTIDASMCALTAQAIENLLAELVAEGKTNGALDIGGGTNVSTAEWSSQAQSDVMTLEEDRGWTILRDTE